MKHITYGLVAEFDSPEALLEAIEHARAAGFKRMDAFTPFPVEGLFEALGKRPTILPLLVLVGGTIGCGGGFFMQWFAAVADYPINVGGRPFNSWPAFIPITFEMTILCAALTAIVAMIVLNKLPTPYHPVFAAENFERATSDRFFLCIESSDARFDKQATTNFLYELGAQNVTEVRE